MSGNSCYRSLRLAVVGGSLRTNLRKTIRTIDGTIASGLEGHLGVFAAARANRREHFPLVAAATATATVTAAGAVSTGTTGIPLIATSLPASGATLRLVGITFLSVVGLVVSTKGKGLTAVRTG